VSDPQPLEECASVRTELSTWMDGEVGPEQQAAVELHLAACSPCRAEAALLRLVSRAARQVPRLEPREALRLRVVDQVRAEVTREPAAARHPHRVEIRVTERPGEHDKRRLSSDYSQWTDAAELPSAQHLIDMLTRLVSNPLALRAQHKLVEHLFDGVPMVLVLPKAELAAALGVGEAELEKALLPLVADETLRWHKTAAGEECYELLRSEPFLHLLSLAQKWNGDPAPS
jgi:putative zinc finger protein